MTHLLCFGLGYSASMLAARLSAKGWRISGTSRTRAGAERLEALGFRGLVFDGTSAGAGIADELATATHVLVSVPPDASGDPVLRLHAADLARAPALSWIGYLSTVGVYGDHAGGWVDETTHPRPVNERSRLRLAAERHWLELGRSSGRPVAALRLSGIYGPGRNALESLLDGTARRIIKPGQVFNRIHVDDIATACEAALAPGAPSGIFNVTDDEPAPPQDVVAFAAQLLGMPVPPDQPIEQAILSPMARTFYGESKRVANRKLREVLGVRLSYPTYREGLRALLASVRPAAGAGEGC